MFSLDHVLGAWDPIKYGPKPTYEEIMQAKTLARPASKAHLAIAMTLRENGATQRQIVAAVGDRCHNKITRVLSRNQAHRVEVYKLQPRNA